MYLVPVLLVSDAADATRAHEEAARELAERALYVGDARRLSPPAIATADFELRVYANNIELPRAAA